MASVYNLREMLSKKLSRFVHQDEGVTAIEFGLLAVPFFGLIVAILETGLILLASQVFDSAVDDAARAIRTGEAAEFEESDFRDRICDHTFGLFTCDSIKLRVRPIASFAAADTTDPVDENGDWDLSEQFSAGRGREVILVEAFYKWSTVLQFEGFSYAEYGDGSLIMTSARVFMNEPF